MRSLCRKLQGRHYRVAVLVVMPVLLSVLFCASQVNSKASDTPVPPPQPDQCWARAKVEVDKSVREIVAQDQAELDRGIRYHKFIRGNPAIKEIAITFDDGPHPKYTPSLLRILKKYDAKATFFVVGKMAEQYPDLIRAEIAGGHSVGDHTYHHVNLTRIPLEDVALEIQSCSDVIKNITGKPTHLFRPPGGDYDREVAEAATALNYTMVLWTDDPGDYASPGDKVIETRLLDRVSNGGIILIHDGVKQTIDVLPQILEYLKLKGYKFVTIDQLIQDSKATRAKPLVIPIKAGGR